MRLHVAPLPAAFLDRVREQGVDDLGQPVRRLTARGGEPCRDVLRRARPGEELILASFSPFREVGPYREFGPVFVLANSGEEIAVRHELPLRAVPHGAAEGYLREQFVLRAHSRDEEILDALMVGPQDAGDALERFFSRSDVAFVHARFPLYGCFACRIDRA